MLVSDMNVGVPNLNIGVGMSYLDIGLLVPEWSAVRKAAENELRELEGKADEECHKTYPV